MAGRIHSGVSTRVLDPAEALDFIADPGCGAIDMFVGVVRNSNLGAKVLAVTYDAHAALADAMLRDIAEETIQAFPALNVYVVHHMGRLEVGGVSIIIAVSSPHRADAFDATRRIIEEVKRRVPVWKEEHYADGRDGWVPGHALTAAG